MQPARWMGCRAISRMWPILALGCAPGHVGAVEPAPEASARPIRLQALAEFSLGQTVGQLRANALRLGEGRPRGVLLAYCADFDVDPYVEMFFFPTDTLKLAVTTTDGQVLWSRDLGKGVVPGMWFCPIAAFDLDGDGTDEVWFVNNVNANHPLGVSGYRLERVDARSGETTGQWPWPNKNASQSLSHQFRNFITGGHVHGDPVLVTAQGTYEDMFLQARNPDMSLRWELTIPRNAPGARGSHVCPITDLDGDGVEEIMWGERCIELDTGKELFCADRDLYRGHSDVIAPFRDPATGRWMIFTCRESDPGVLPRVAAFDDKGQKAWGAVDQGHMDMGWVARLGDGGAPVAMAIRIGRKTCGPDGRFHYDRDEFVFDAVTGKELKLPFSVYGTIPVDLNGDGHDELVYGIPGQNGRAIDRHGNDIGSVGGSVAVVGNLTGSVGQQLLVYHPDGKVQLWGHADE